MNWPVTTRSSAFVIGEQTRKMTDAEDELLVAGAYASDEALMAQICNGSREALAALFRRYARLVRTVAARIRHLGSTWDGERRSRLLRSDLLFSSVGEE